MVRRAAPADAAQQEYGMLTTLYALRRAFLADLPAAVQPAAGQPGAVQPGAVQPAAVQPAADRR
jgi:hypothetical protein